MILAGDVSSFYLKSIKIPLKHQLLTSTSFSFIGEQVFFFFLLKRGSYMSAHVLLNLLDEFGKR